MHYGKTIYFLVTAQEDGKFQFRVVGDVFVQFEGCSQLQTWNYYSMAKPSHLQDTVTNVKIWMKIWETVCTSIPLSVTVYKVGTHIGLLYYHIYSNKHPCCKKHPFCNVHYVCKSLKQKIYRSLFVKLKNLKMSNWSTFGDTLNVWTYMKPIVLASFKQF